MMFKGPRLVGVAVIGTVGLLLLAACSSSPSGPGGSPLDSSGTSSGGTPQNPDDPCSLLTHEQASEIIGEPAKPGRRNDTICMWDSTMGAGPFIKIDMIWKALYDGAANTVARGVTKTSVDGIGDEAFAKGAGQAGHILWFRSGDKYFQVNVFALRGQLKDLDAEKQIARYILQRL